MEAIGLPGTNLEVSKWTNPRLKGRLPELDGVRGLAILLVLVWHYFIDSIHPANVWQANILAAFRLTWSGVDLFFVLSGFLIGGILYDAKDSGNYYQVFYLRRMHRIFPMYFLFIAVFVVGLYLNGKLDLFNRYIPGWSYLLFVQNFFMSSRGTFGTQGIAMTWSLAVEEQFYLLLPLLIRRFNTRAIVGVVLASILAAPVVRIILWWSGNTFFGPYTLLPCRADALGLGVLIAIACRNQNAWRWLSSHRAHLYWAFLVLGCGVAYLTVRQESLYTFGFTWIAAFYAVVLLLAVVNPGRIEKAIFGNRLLTALGTVAYVVYLFHQAININFHSIIFGGGTSITGWASLSVTILSIVTVLSLSAVTWKVIEQPLIRRAREKYQYTPQLTTA